MYLIYLPKFCITIVFNFSSVSHSSQDKLCNILGVNKLHYGLCENSEFTRGFFLRRLFIFFFRWTADSLLRCWPLHESTGRSYGNWSLLQGCRRRNQVILISLFQKYCFASQIFHKISFGTYYRRLNLKLSTPLKTKILIEARSKLFKSWIIWEKEISNTRKLRKNCELRVRIEPATLQGLVRTL